MSEFGELLKAFRNRPRTLEGIYLWPYATELTHEQLMADWLPAWERCPWLIYDDTSSVRFVVAGGRLRVTMPGRRELSWDPVMFLWERRQHAIATRPRIRNLAAEERATYLARNPGRRRLALAVRDPVVSVRRVVPHVDGGSLVLHVF